MKRIVQKSISLTLILLVLAGCFLPGISMRWKMSPCASAISSMA